MPVYACARLPSSSLLQLTMNHFQQGYLSIRASQGGDVLFLILQQITEETNESVFRNELHSFFFLFFFSDKTIQQILMQEWQMPDIHVKPAATLNLRCFWSMNMNKEMMKDNRVGFFCLHTLLKIYFYNALHICNCSQYYFPSTLLLQAIYFASHSLQAVSVAYSGPQFVGGELVSIWPSGV